MKSIDWNTLMNPDNQNPLEPGLYICPTPIGNLMDITLRTLNTLNAVDIIAAEDTRHTLKLLNHYGISKKLISYHEHNIKKRGPELIEMLKQGLKIGLVSDAGMPGISDPGADIIALAIAENLPVKVLPGPCAAITALVGSGLKTEQFIFAGFLDRQSSKRKKQVQELLKMNGTIILYEAPHRVVSTLEDIKSVGYTQKVVLAREITKRYEEFKRNNIEILLQEIKERPPKGEMVLLIESNGVVEDREYNMDEQIEVLKKQGLSTKEISKKIAKETGVSRNEIYQKLVNERE